MTKIEIRTDDVPGFFSRARDAARRADRGNAFEGKVTLSFEDPQRMFTVLSQGRRRLMLEVMHEPRRLTSYPSACIATVPPLPRTLGCWRRSG
ncbi:MAG: hypothetical protein ACTS6J_13270 [Burkholderiales bacterium]